MVYQLEHQNKVIKLSMNKLLNTLNYTWVIKNNWLQYHTIHVFQKQAKNGKHVYNIENLNIKTNLDCMAFTSLLCISSSSFTLALTSYICLQLFRTSLSIIWKKISITNFSFLTDSLKPPTLFIAKIC